MGWWGYGLFSGDSPLDWIGKVEKDLEHHIDQVIHKGYYDGCNVEDLPAMIFFYADMMRRYSRHKGNLYDYVEWLRSYVKDLKENNTNGWKSKDERADTVETLANEIEALFNEGYKLDHNKYPKATIANQRVYHLTRKELLSDIFTEGLKPQECHAGLFENKPGIYISSSLLGAMKWQFHVLGHKLTAEPAFVSFIVDEKDEVYQDLRVDFKDDFVVCNKILPTRLAIFA
jgi:hypothetical protein